MKRELSTEQLCTKAAAYCTLAEHCASEVSAKVLAWGGNDEQASLVVAYLEKETFISEARYARAFVHDKMLFQHWSKQKIYMALRAKQVSESEIQEALSQVDEDTYLDDLRQQMISKWESITREFARKGDTDENKKRAKLMRYLLSKGYRYGEIEQALHSLPNDEK